MELKERRKKNGWSYFDLFIIMLIEMYFENKWGMLDLGKHVNAESTQSLDTHTHKIALI